MAYELSHWEFIFMSLADYKRPSDNDLHAAFMSGEPLSAEGCRMLACLFDGSFDKDKKIGRPKKPDFEKFSKQLRGDLAIFREIEAIAAKLRADGVKGPITAAIKQKAEAVGRSYTPGTIRRRYERGKLLAKDEK